MSTNIYKTSMSNIGLQAKMFLAIKLGINILGNNNFTKNMMMMLW